MRETQLRSIRPSEANSVVVNLPIRTTIGWRALHGYWSAKRSNGRLPGRRDIDPIIDIPRLVANLVLLDAPEGDFRYRVVGTKIDQITQRPITGRKVAEAWWGNDPGGSEWRVALSNTAQRQRPSLYMTMFPYGIDVRCVALLLPLVDSTGRTDQILVGAFWDGFLPPGTPLLRLTAMGID
jgi:hypothetical protein